MEQWLNWDDARQTLDLGSYEEAVQAELAGLEASHFSDRLCQRDPSLWKDDPQSREVIRNALGWLDVGEKMQENLVDLVEFAAHVREAGFHQVVHMGMGGSSLTPLVFERTCWTRKHGLPLRVLDNTDPATILELARQVPLADTLFIVATKCGT